MGPCLRDIQEAAESFRGIISPSPLVFSGYFSRKFKADIFLKLENLQETGSFKIRGAYNRLRRLSSREKATGVITASAGNHGQGVAWASQRIGTKATIVMPEKVSLRKLLAVRDYGGETILFGRTFADAHAHAISLSEKRNQLFVPGFDDFHVIAGQGTVGLELSDHLDANTVVVVPVGGGGLIAGIARSVKGLCPDTRIIGVQTKSCPSMILSLEKSRPTEFFPAPTLADGIAVTTPGTLNLSMVQQYVDCLVAVNEEAVAVAVLNLLEKANIVAEGAGAVPLAALLEECFHHKAKRYILVISGGNIEVNTIDLILQRGLIQQGRLINIEINLFDSPGSLWRLLGVITEEKANILQISHNRLDIENPIGMSRVLLQLETRGSEHGVDIVSHLEREGYPVRLVH
jgi:threonine dehydratase